MYDWRKMTDEERKQTLQERKLKGMPWHSPPHIAGRSKFYHFCAACYEHKPIIGLTQQRLTYFSNALMECLSELQAEVFAWCVLPNHYHLLLRIEALAEAMTHLGKLHGRTSFMWNGEEDTRGRKNWCNIIDKWIRDERHFRTALNYIHHNPVKHDLEQKWQDWPFSSAENYLVFGRKLSDTVFLSAKPQISHLRQKVRREESTACERDSSSRKVGTQNDSNFIVFGQSLSNQSWQRKGRGYLVSAPRSGLCKRLA